MADQQTPQPGAELTDEEKKARREAKKAAKAAKKAAAKARAAAKAAEQAGGGGEQPKAVQAGGKETSATEEELRQQRLDKLARLKAGGVHPYPERFERTHTLAECAQLPEGTTGVRVAGRVYQMRQIGNLTFATLQDLHGSVQISLSKKGLHEDPEESKKLYTLIVKNLDRWDFLGVEGEMYRTKMGELTVQVQAWTFLGKALAPPPNKYQGLKDTEVNWRKRYVDLVSNQDTRDRFRLRSRVTKAMRSYLDDHGFDEVETPILCTQASGALARPFYSHHNSLDMPVVMRIAPETYLKRLIVGGYDRVYEFARCFRNEGMDPSHLQDFTMLEYYCAYWNYEDNMRFTEALLKHVLQEATGGLTVKQGDVEIDFSGDWPRLSLRDAIKDACGVDIDEFETAEALRAEILKLKVELENPNAGRGSLIDQLYKRTARPTLIQPTFIMRHPIDLSPLARRSDDDAKTADRFQLVVNTWEIVNAYSELVDPLDQRGRLEEQARLRGAGDDEAMELDDDYLGAMEYGMPPISGWGMGIDRFVALISDVPNLRDVVWFPLLRPTSGVDPEQSRCPHCGAPAEPLQVEIDGTPRTRCQHCRPR